MTANTATFPKRHRITTDEYHRMGEAGILSEDDRVELIEGEVIDMTPIGNMHAYTVSQLTQSLIRAFDANGVVWVQNPIRLSPNTEPQPDIAVLRSPLTQYADRLPTAEDVQLLIEVSDTSRAYDRNIKMPLYARFSIPECWLIDLEQQVVEVFRAPSSDSYRDVKRFGPGETIRLSFCPDVEIELSTLFSGL
ncbi:MAG: Uma2 family endonuclease [Methylothermaceae bacterium]|nr:Uma2 family endonuclease [Methylothermaceae bacterium]